MARICVFKNCEVVEEHRTLWNKMVEKEIKELDIIWKRMLIEDPTLKQYTPKDKVKDAEEALMAAAFRFGSGSIWYDEEYDESL